jgi:short-subunit dehydrogenase
LRARILTEFNSDKELRGLFDVNYFGHVPVTKAILPCMRQQKSGIVGFTGSLCSWTSSMGGTALGATKYAIAGLAQSLGCELRQFGIHVILFDPGHFRTQFLSSAKKLFPDTSLESYAPMMEEKKKKMAAGYRGLQPGDPAKPGKVIVGTLTGSSAFKCKELPTRLVFGSNAVGRIEAHLGTQKASFDELKIVSTSTEASASE